MNNTETGVFKIIPASDLMADPGTTMCAPLLIVT